MSVQWVRGMEGERKGGRHAGRKEGRILRTPGPSPSLFFLMMVVSSVKPSLLCVKLSRGATQRLKHGPILNGLDCTAH